MIYLMQFVVVEGKTTVPFVLEKTVPILCLKRHFGQISKITNLDDMGLSGVPMP